MGKKRKVRTRKHTSSRTSHSHRSFSRNGGSHSRNTKKKNKTDLRQDSSRGGKEESRSVGGFIRREEEKSKRSGKEGLRTGGGFVKRKEHGVDYSDFYNFHKAASLINDGAQVTGDVTPALNGMNYVDSNEDYQSNKQLMAAPGFNSKSQKKTKTASSDSNEKPEESQPKANKKKVVASSDSSEKPEKKPKTEKKEIEAQREDFEEVF